MEITSVPHRKQKIFISSVFREDGKDWELRSCISKKLIEQGHETWLWEVNGEEEQARNKGGDWKDIISEAISTHDIVITFYKKRAGDPSRYFGIPFYPTDYEMAEAIKHGTPLRLFIIKSRSTSNELKSIKALYTIPSIIGSKPIYCLDESDFIDKALHEVKNTSSTGISLANTHLIHLPFEHQKADDTFEYFHTMLASQINDGDYVAGYNLLKMSLEIRKVIPKTMSQKALKAECLADQANIYANRAMYRKAIETAYQSIRLFMESGEHEKLFSQIQALSGIQNMAGYKSASWLNAYGYKSIKIYKNLASDFRDSKASILRDLNDYNEAFDLFNGEEIEKSPYSAAKYAHLMGFRSKKNSVNDARKLMEDTIIPRARTESKDLAYVLREAGVLAFRDGDISACNNFLDEAEKISDRMGTIHTKTRIIQIRQQISCIR